jgi:hypothetical protein
MKTKHTPGPWKYEKWDSLAGIKFDRYEILVDYKHPFLDKVTIANVGDAIEEKEANARLIAAAPQMLAALELIATCEKEVGRMNSVMYLAAMQAIKKATQ